MTPELEVFERFGKQKIVLWRYEGRQINLNKFEEHRNTNNTWPGSLAE